ncbi:hypothetical protein A6V39_04955 [Candidatus Mycoplasma haematobovis]|uniref:Uncharacterized protein n=1 Tax=Candidatus Mycoplasma haematobovis TaxID=432608 RepID=A0A1A9QCT6_9MOLU|nr:hypothetical protein [Candidatus Mycoplasma haematobovis]OAL09776.1 hypothetical protein A6V39_04955 [Candidatus Mycoplasma haematobovis]
MNLSPSIAAKLAIGLTGAAAISTGSYVAYDRLTKESISELIKKEDLKLLSSSDSDTEWLKRWKEYVAKGNNIWRLDNYTGKTTSESDIPQNFKDTCYSKASERTTDNKSDTYQQVKDLCTKSFSISSLIGEEKDIVLINANQGDAKWNKAWKNYIANINNNNELGLDDWPTIKESNSLNAPNDYKTKCDSKKQTEVKNTKDPTYLAVKQWCTEAKSD